MQESHAAAGLNEDSDLNNSVDLLKKKNQLNQLFAVLQKKTPATYNVT